jgi:hypothetical protein
MKGGRLKVVNESSYDGGEVEALVRFGLSEIDLTGDRIVALVKHTRATRRQPIPYAISGVAYSLVVGIPSDMYDRYCGRRTMTDHLIVLRLGLPESFPETSWRTYAGVPQREYRTWREGLVAITAHEGLHAQHSHDGAYRQKSGQRKPAMIDGQTIRRGGRFRVGVERIEPKCEAFEAYMLRRFRQDPLSQPSEFATFEDEMAQLSTQGESGC